MRRFSLVLIAVGAFLIVLGPMIRWYAYPRLAVAPANQISDTGLEAKDAVIFDRGSLKEITTDLTTKVHTVGDAKTPKNHSGVITYVNSTQTFAKGQSEPIDSNIERMSFDPHTGEAVKGCCSDFISSETGVDTPVVHTGLVAKFPFETQKKTYNFWDSTLKASYPIKYEGTTNIEGMTVYKFGQTIAKTKSGETNDVPLSVLGLSGDGNVTADNMYAVDRTLWVEPNTGVIIKRVEAQNSTLDYQDEPRVTTTKAVITYDAKTIRKNIDDYGSQGKMLNLVHNVVPQVSFVIGLLMLIGGVFMSRRRTTSSATPETRVLAGAHA
jgi:hypothetical protein